MKICLVSSECPHEPGGTQWSLRRIATLLTEANHEVHVVRLLLDPDPADWESSHSAIRELEPLPCGARTMTLSPWLSTPGTLFAQHEVSDAFQQLDESNEYHLVHGIGVGQPVFIAALVAKMRDKPVVVSGRGSDVNLGRFRSGLDHLWLLQNADWITFASHLMRARVSQLVDCEARSSVVYNSTALRFFRSDETTPEDVGQPESPVIRIGGAGRLSYKKGADVLYLAFRELKERWPEITLHWIGEKDLVGKRRGRHSDALFALEESGELTFTGPVAHEAILQHMRQLDIFVLCSVDEGCPNSLLEAMLARRPVVATRVGAVPEIIRDGTDGLLVHPYDPAGIAAAVDSLLRDRRLGSSLAARAFDRVEECCSPEQEGQAWQNCYAEALRIHRG